MNKLSALCNLLKNTLRTKASQDFPKKFKRVSAGYVLILFVVTVPILLLGTRYVLDKMTESQVKIEQSKGTVTYFKRCAKEAALAVAKNWNPGMNLSYQKDALMKIADAVYNDNLCYMFNDAETGIIGSAISGLDERKSARVSHTGSKFNPIKVVYNETKTHSSILAEKEIKYTEATKYLLRYCRGYYTTAYDGTGGGYENVYHRIWREIDLNTDQSYRCSYFDEVDETERTKQNYVLKHHDIYTLPCRANPTDLTIRTDATGQMLYPNNNYFWPGCSDTHNRFYVTIPSTSSSVSQYYPWKYHSSYTVAGNYTTVTSQPSDGTKPTTYKKRTTPSGIDPINIEIDSANDRIKVTTDSGTGYQGTVGYAKPAECNVDIVLAIPVNGAASNNSNNDAASATAGAPVTANEEGQTVSLSSTTKGTPIYQMGQACKNFVKDNFYHIKGVTMGLIPYSAKVSISPDKAGYTITKPTFVNYTALNHHYPTAAMYGTRGEAGASLINSYVWGGILTGCPIMCRRGNTTTWWNTQLAYGNLLSNASPGSGDQYKYMKMNLNPCIAGYANQLSMRCERRCTTYFPNPYYMIEPTADMVKIYEMCNALFPIYDPNNVSNFLFIPFEWANNFWQSWTTDVTASASTDTLSRPSKTTSGRKKALVMLVNKPDWFEPGEMTYLGFDNDYSSVPLAESDKIDFSINYSDTSKKFLDGTNYNGTPRGPKKIVYFTGMSRNSSTGCYESTGNAICRLYFPRRCRVKVTVKPQTNNSGDVNWSNWKYYSNALNRQGPSCSNWMNNGYNGIAYKNGRFVIVSEGGSYTAYSDNGYTWHRGQSLSKGLCAMTASSDYFIAVCSSNKVVYYSSDGTNWSIGSTSGYPYSWHSDIFWDGNYLYMISGCSVYRGNNSYGTSWTSAGSIPSYITSWDRLEYGGGYYVKIGQSSSSLRSASSTSHTSYRSYTLPYTVKGPLHYGNGYWLAISTAGILMKSTDSSATSWSVIAALGQSDWSGLRYGGGRWVAYTRTGDVAVLDTTPTESTIRFTNVGDNTLYTIKDEKTFTIEPGQLSSDTSCYVEFNAYDIQMVSAEITNLNFTICKPVQTSYKDIDYNTISMTKTGTPTVSTVTETIDFANGYDSCHVGKFMVDQTKAIGDAKMNRTSGREGYELSAADRSEIPCRIEADYPCDVQLEVEPISINADNASVTFYTDNITDSISSSYDVKKDGSSISLGSAQSVSSSGNTFVFAGGSMPVAGSRSSCSSVAVTSTLGKNFSHNLCVKKVRYSLLNATITNCVLKNQILRDYMGDYSYKNSSYKALIMNNGSSARRSSTSEAYNPHRTDSSIINTGADYSVNLGSAKDTVIAKFRDKSITYLDTYWWSTWTSYEYIRVGTGHSPLYIVVYGVQPPFVISMGNRNGSTKCSYYTSSNSYADILSAYSNSEYYWSNQYTCATTSGYGISGIKLKFYDSSHSLGGLHQYYIQNQNDKTLQSTTPITEDPITYQDLIENKGIYLANYNGEKWICFQGDGELHVTVKPARIENPTFKLYTMNSANTTEDGIVVGYNNSTSQALNIGASGVSVDSSYTCNPTSSQTITIPKSKFIWNGDCTGHDYHLLFSCRDLRIKKVTLTYDLFARSYRLKASKSGTALIQVFPTNSITSSTTTSNALNTWVSRNDCLSSICYLGAYGHCGNPMLYANGKFLSRSWYTLSGNTGTTGVPIGHSANGEIWSLSGTSACSGSTGSTFANGFLSYFSYNYNWLSYSSDGNVWSNGGSVGGRFVNGVTFGNGMLLTTDSAYRVFMTAITSNGSHSWANQNANLSSIISKEYDKLAFGNGKFIVCSPQNTVAYSYDGRNWTNAGAVLCSLDSGYDTVTYGNGKFLYLSRTGAIATSVDGISWSWVGGSSSVRPLFNATNLSDDWNGIVYGKGRWVAVNNNGYVATCDEPLPGYDLSPWYKIGSGSETKISSNTTLAITLSSSPDSDGKYYADVTLYNAEAKGNSALIYDESRTVYDVIPFYNNNTTSHNSSYRALEYSGASGSHIGNNLYSRSGSGSIYLKRRGKLRLKLMSPLNTTGTFQFTTGSDTSSKTVSGMQELTVTLGNQANNSSYDYVSFNMSNIVLVKAEFESAPEISSPNYSSSWILNWKNNGLSRDGNIDLSGSYYWNTDERRYQLTNNAVDVWNNGYVSDITATLDTKSPIFAYWFMPEYYYNDSVTNFVGPVRLFSQIRRSSARKFCQMYAYNSSYSNKANLLWHNFTLPLNHVLYRAGYQSAGGDATAATRSATAAVCAKLKSDYGSNLRVYIVKYRKQTQYKTFPNYNVSQTNADHTYSTIDACATSSSYVYDVSNETDLKTTLNAIANDIKNFAGGVIAARNVD